MMVPILSDHDILYCSPNLVYCIDTVCSLLYKHTRVHERKGETDRKRPDCMGLQHRRVGLQTSKLALAVLLCAPMTTKAGLHKPISSITWESIKHKFVGGPYAGAGGMAVGGGSVGVEEFADDAEAIRAIRLFPDVMHSFGGLRPDATDAEVSAIFLPALKVMLPHGGYVREHMHT